MSAYDNATFVYGNGLFTAEAWQIGVSTAMVIAFTALASAAGIGGGGLVVPVYSYVLGTGVAFASPISTATILGVALGKNFISIQRRHPMLVRPLINYDLATYIQITVFLGTIIGVVLYGILPDIVITMLLALVLGFSGIKALMKGSKLAKREAIERRSQVPKNAPNLDNPHSLTTLRASPRAHGPEKGMYFSASLQEIEMPTISLDPPPPVGSTKVDASTPTIDLDEPPSTANPAQQEPNSILLDIKPDNIFVHEDERQQRPFLVLGDIGLAKRLNRSASLVSAAGAVAYRAPEACIDAAKCSQASDIFSVSLVAVELVTRRCVYSECNGDLAMATPLVAEATARLTSALEFCGDSWLSSEAAEMLLGACTVQDPAARTSFRAIVATCPRHERTTQEVRRTSARLREQQLRETQAALEAAAKQQADREQQLREMQAALDAAAKQRADREQQLREMQAAREAAAKQQAHHEEQLREVQAAREAAAKQQADREQQLQAAREAAAKQQAHHDQQLREMQAALEAATKQQTHRDAAAPRQQRSPSENTRAMRKAEQNDGRRGQTRRPSAGVVALRRPTTATLEKRTSVWTPTDRAKYVSRQ